MPPTITATDHPLEKLTGDAVVVAVGKGPDGPLPTPGAEAVDGFGSGSGQQPVGPLADGDDDGVSGQLLERVVGGVDRRRHRSIVGAPLACPS